jgi:hypothetical protein
MSARQILCPSARMITLYQRYVQNLLDLACALGYAAALVSMAQRMQRGRTWKERGAWQVFSQFLCATNSAGATLLTLGYQIFMGWVAANPHAGQAQAESNMQSVR